MFNFIASSLMVYLLVDVLKPVGSMAPQTRNFAEGGQLPTLDWLLRLFGLDPGIAPFNISFLVALAACFLVWLLVWRTRFGYELRTRAPVRRPPAMPESTRRASSSSPW